MNNAPSITSGHTALNMMSLNLGGDTAHPNITSATGDETFMEVCEAFWVKVSTGPCWVAGVGQTLFIFTMFPDP